MTRKHQGKYAKTGRRIRFDDFYNQLLKIMGKIVFPEFTAEVAMEELFEQYLYPNLVANFPYLLQRERPEIKTKDLFTDKAQRNYTQIQNREKSVIPRKQQRFTQVKIDKIDTIEKILPIEVNRNSKQFIMVPVVDCGIDVQNTSNESDVIDLDKIHDQIKIEKLNRIREKLKLTDEEKLWEEETKRVIEIGSPTEIIDRKDENQFSRVNEDNPQHYNKIKEDILLDIQVIQDEVISPIANSKVQSQYEINKIMEAPNLPNNAQIPLILHPEPGRFEKKLFGLDENIELYDSEKFHGENVFTNIDEHESPLRIYFHNGSMEEGLLPNAPIEVSDITPRFLTKCMRSSISLIIKCIKGCFAPIPKLTKTHLLSLELGEAFDITEESLTERRKSPDWPQITNKLLNSMQICLEQAKNKLASVHITILQLNLTNAVGLIGQILEMYTFVSIAFSSPVGWLGAGNSSEGLAAVDGIWKASFWCAIGLSVVFFILVKIAIKYLGAGMLGLNSDKSIAKFPSAQFFLSKSLTLLGDICYLSIVKILLGAFACEITNSSWSLIQSPDIECFTIAHSPYLIAGVLALLIYYPAATLLYPNLQYQDKALDLKFDTTFLVLESQGKLIVAGFAAFFNSKDFLWLQLAVVIAVCVFLFYWCCVKKPCIIVSINAWKAGGFLAIAWICMWALVNRYARNMQIIAFICMVIGVGGVGAVLIILQCTVFGCSFCCRKTSYKIVEGFNEDDQEFNEENEKEKEL